MKQRTLICCLFLVQAGLAGCGWFEDSTTPQASKSSSGGVAVIDLDAVATELGRRQQMTQALEAQQQAATQRLEALRVSYEQDVQRQQQIVGPSPTPEQSAQLRDYVQDRNAQYTAKARAETANINAEQARLVQQFRNEVRPIAQNVASELGLSLVVTKNEEYLLSFATSVDITTAVISRMQPHHQHASADHNHQHRSTDHTTEHARSADPSAPRPLPVQAAQESRPLQ